MFTPSPLVKEVFVDWEGKMEEDKEDNVEVILQTFSVDKNTM